jgi:hypothetical protein
MPGFNDSQALQALQTPASSLRTFWSHPRFLRAIPSLMVLTTAIAWGVSSHAGGLAPDGALRSGTGVNMAAMGAVGGETDTQMQGAASVDTAGAVARGVLTTR